VPRPFRRRGHARVGAIVLVLGGLFALTGCDVSENSDLERGRALFQARCGTCHALSEAGTSAEIGPDLDAAFADARASGMDNDTIEGVVQQQIANPREVNEGDPDYDRTFMPADLVTGEDAENVAAYVASVAGIPGIEPPQLPPDQLFTERCGSCHTLAAAGTTGTQGPDLDDVLQGQSAQKVEQSVVDPNAQITQGFQPDVMPQDFGQSLTPDQLGGLVQYLLDNVGGGQAGGGGQGGGGS
jgi:mono/diheme cytochrome c family protein